jgi:hypothetical protein
MPRQAGVPLIPCERVSPQERRGLCRRISRYRFSGSRVWVAPRRPGGISKWLRSKRFSSRWTAPLERPVRDSCTRSSNTDSKTSFHRKRTHLHAERQQNDGTGCAARPGAGRPDLRRRSVGTMINRHLDVASVALQRMVGFDWLLKEQGYSVQTQTHWSVGQCDPRLLEVLRSQTLDGVSAERKAVHGRWPTCHLHQGHCAHCQPRSRNAGRISRGSLPPVHPCSTYARSASCPADSGGARSDRPHGQAQAVRHSTRPGAE